MAMRALLLLASAAAVVLLPGAQAARAGCSPNLAWQDRFPQWSPTGGRFLYLRETVECAPAPNDLVLARPDGATTRTFHHASSPSWSPGGRQVAFVGDGRIRIASAVGGRVPALGRADALVWGAGGIAFLRGGELWLADPIRQTERPLATGFDLVGPLAWTPTREVVTVRRARRGDDESEQLVAVEEDGFVRELTPPGGRYDTISVDGANGILFFAHRPTDRLWGVEALRMTTGDRWPVASDAEDAFYPSVSPDGTRVAFLRLVAFDDAVLSVASSDGGASVDIALDAHRFSPPAWSPDGRRLLFARGDPCQRWGINVVRASGGSLARLTNQCRFFGTARGDRLRGSPFLDDLYGFGGDDRLDGRGGRDRLLGGEGDDLLLGGAGEDDIQAGPGRDRVVAGDANDIVRVSDGSRDVVSCGRASYDIVYADRRDVVGRDCERVYRM